MVRRQIAVVGGGLAGWSAALSLGAKGLETVLVAPPAATDRRTTALIGGTVDHLREIGVWDHLANAAQPLNTMRIIDDTGRLLRAPTVEFRATEIERAEFGFNANNEDILTALEATAPAYGPIFERVEKKVASMEHASDRVILRLDDGEVLEVDLVVGADGRSSRIREDAGIGFDTWTYPQTAIVLNFGHEFAHDGCSTEFHRRSGPFTQVPLRGRRSALVWVEEPGLADLVLGLTSERLSREVERRLHSILGKVDVEDGVQSFPLSGGRARRLASDRIALVGEAAHVFPPIGAQGLNLGVRDGRRLAEAVSRHRDDPGSASALASYEAVSRADIWTRTVGVDVLNRSLMTDLLPLQAARAAGLSALAAFGPIRRYAMREGLSPGLGFRDIAGRWKETVNGHTRRQNP